MNDTADHLAPALDDRDPQATPRASVRIVEAGALGIDTIARMYGIFERYYDDVSASAFRSDLADKTHVIMLVADDNRIVGFSTLRWYPIEHDGHRERVIFSGDTIIDRPWWGTQQLAIGFCALAGRLKARHPDETLWWFLISKGHRTYRYLPAFARRFHPSLQEPTPAAIQARMDRLARERFGDAYDPARGVVRFARPQGRLKARWQASRADDDARTLSPTSRFFEVCNPGYAEGNELVCLTELSHANMRRTALAAFGDGFAAATRALPLDAVDDRRVTIAR